MATDESQEVSSTRSDVLSTAADSLPEPLPTEKDATSIHKEPPSSIVIEVAETLQSVAAITEEKDAQKKKECAALASAEQEANSASAATPVAVVAKPPPAPTPETPLFIKTDQKVEKEWKQQYDLLVALKKVTKNTNVPDDGTYFSKWVKRQNYEYTVFLDVLEGRNNLKSRSISMNETKMRMLRDLGFVFAKQSAKGYASKKEMVWDAKADMLRKYRNKHGHTNAPVNDKNLEDDQERQDFKGLGSWVSVMRAKMRLDGTKEADPFITPARIQRLLDIGLSTAAPRGGRKRKVVDVVERDNEQAKKLQKKKLRFEERWEKYFEQMKQFGIDYGHTIVPGSKQWYSLRNWMECQQKEFKKVQQGEPSLLSANKLQRLTDIGFTFHARKRHTYEERLQQWLDYRKEHGRDPTKLSDDNGLGVWISQTRAKYHKMKKGQKTNVSQDQFDFLTQHGFVWCAINPENRTKPKPWAERYAELQEYVEANGHALVPQSMAGLGEWVHKQRTEGKIFMRGEKSVMTQEKVDKLNAAGFVWVARDRSAVAKRANSDDDSSDEEEEEDQILYRSPRRGNYAYEPNSRRSNQSAYAPHHRGFRL